MTKTNSTCPLQLTFQWEKSPQASNLGSGKRRAATLHRIFSFNPATLDVRVVFISQSGFHKEKNQGVGISRVGLDSSPGPSASNPNLPPSHRLLSDTYILLSRSTQNVVTPG